MQFTVLALSTVISYPNEPNVVSTAAYFLLSAIRYAFCPLKVIGFCTNRTPIRYMTWPVLATFLCEVENHATPDWAAIERPPVNVVIKLIARKAGTFDYVSVKIRDFSVSRFITIHLRHRRQTTYHDHSRTLQCSCNVWLKMVKAKHIGCTCAQSGISWWTGSRNVDHEVWRWCGAGMRLIRDEHQLSSRCHCCCCCCYVQCHVLRQRSRVAW